MEPGGAHLLGNAGLSLGAKLRGLRRTCGMSQDRLVVALEELAELNDGRPSASRASLKVNVSRWENDHQVPDEYYRGLLCQIFGVRAEDLGVQPASLGASTHGSPLSPRQITPEVVAYFWEVFQQYVRADQLLGPGQLRGVVNEQITQLESLCQDARGQVRQDLLYLATRYTELLGWLCQDSADLATADRWTARAGELAQLVGDPRLTAYVAMRRAGILAELGRPADSLSFAELAARTSIDIAPRLGALTQRQLALTQAMLGDQVACRTAVDAALSAVTSPDDGSFSVTSYCTPAFVAMETGGSLARMGALDLAADHLTQAVTQWPPGQQRDKGLCLARLADVHAAAGDVEAACGAATLAVDLLAVAPSARTAQTLRGTRNRLYVHRRSPAVRQLAARLADVV